MQVSGAPGQSGGIWLSISQEDAKAMDEATEMDLPCRAGIYFHCSSLNPCDLVKDVVQANPQSLALDVGCTPCSLSGWAELLPEDQDHLRAQSQMRPTILLCSIFCWSLVNSLPLKLGLVPDLATNSMCLILDTLTFQTNWVYRFCLCAWTFKWHFRG